MNITYVLSISRQGLNCSDVAEYMKNLQIPCSVTPNVTVRCHTLEDNTTKCEVEQGCSVIFNERPYVWNNLKSKFDLNCAHLHAHSNYEGCIYDYVRSSDCPSSEKKFKEARMEKKS